MIGTGLDPATLDRSNKELAWVDFATGVSFRRSRKLN